MRTYKNNMSRQPAGPFQLASPPCRFVSDAADAERHWAGLEACAAAMDIDSGYFEQRSSLHDSAHGDFFARRAQQKYCGEGRASFGLPISQDSIYSSGSFYRYNGDYQIQSIEPGRLLNPGKKNRSSKVKPQEFPQRGLTPPHADVAGALALSFGEQVQETLNKLTSEGLELDDSFFSLISIKIEEELGDEQKIRIALKILKTKLRKMKRKSRKVRNSEEKEALKESTSEQSLDATPKQSGHEASKDVRPAPDKPVPSADLSSPETALRFLLCKLTRKPAQVPAAGGLGSPTSKASSGEGKQPTAVGQREAESRADQSMPSICAPRQYFTHVSKYLDERGENYAFKRSPANRRYPNVACASDCPA